MLDLPDSDFIGIDPHILYLIIYNMGRFILSNRLDRYLPKISRLGQSLYTQLLHVESSIMDVYAFADILLTEEQDEIYCVGKKHKISVIYLGIYHIRHYQRWFEQLGAAVPYKIEGRPPEVRCVPIKPIIDIVRVSK